MSLPPNFRETLSNKSDVELYEILDHSGDYIPEAVDAAKSELIRRDLSVDRAAQIQALPEPVVNASRRLPGLFFRWTVARVVLWFFGVVYAVFGVLNIWMAGLASRGSLGFANMPDHDRVARMLLRGAFENFIVAALCIFAWYLMRRRTPLTLSAGALMVVTGLLLTVRRSFYAWSGSPHYPWVEPLLVWPFLVYAFFYGLRTSRDYVSPLITDASQKRDAST